MRAKTLLTYSKNDLFNALCRASAKGRLLKVQYLLTMPAVLEKVAHRSNEPLRKAAEKGHIEIVKLLLKIQAVREQVTAIDNYAFRHAAGNGHLAIVKLLLTIPEVRAHAAINQNYALRWSAANGYLDVVNCLLDIEVVANNATAISNQALLWAVGNRHHRVAARLLRVPAVLGYMREHDPDFFEDNQAFFDELREQSKARAILARKLAEQKLTQHKLPFDVIVKILENHSHAVICSQSQCDQSTWNDGQPYCTLVHNYASRATGRVKPQDTANQDNTSKMELKIN